MTRFVRFASGDFVDFGVVNARHWWAQVGK